MADVGSNDLGWPWKAGCEESIFFRRILITLGRSATSLHLCIAWFFSDSWVSCLFRYFYVTDILSLLFRWKICSPAVRQNSEKGESWHFGHFRGIPKQKHIDVINIAGYSGRYYPLDAMRMRGLCCCHVSVRPSVRLSVCDVGALFRHGWRIFKLLDRPDRPIILGFLTHCVDTQFQGKPRHLGRKIHAGGKNWRFLTEIAVYLGNGAR